MADLLSWEALLGSASWVHLLLCREQRADEFIQTAPASEQIVARILRGKRCASVASLFQEWAAALQFPYYFGENWDAFEECINDLEWLPGRCYAFLITNINHVLSRDVAELRIFTEILRSAASEWSRPHLTYSERPGLTARFRIIFHCEPADHAAAIRHLEAAGVEQGLLPLWQA